ncbi:MAG: hypothetical protein QM534_10330 [Sediminibacterium sp.]|nr:hypothetical protein [Sediminibacterium sp.]
METGKNKKYAGKAQYINEKYQLKKYEDFTKPQFIALIKELVNELKGYEKAINTFERGAEKNQTEILNLKKKLSLFYGTDDVLEKYVGYNPEWTYIDKICFVMERHQNPITGKKIVELLLKIEPQLNKKLADPYNSITKAIYLGIKLNRITKHNKTGNNGYSYILNNAK